MQKALLSALVLLMACAPAAPEVVAPIAKPTPPSTPAPPAEAPHATWLFANAVAMPVAELDLGDKGILQVGAGGRRWILGRSEKDAVETSSVLLAQNLIDVRRDGNKYVFLGVDGTTYIADDPLGAPKVTHQPPPRPSDGKARYAMSKHTILGLARDGTLFRSTDFGATWTKSKTPGAKEDVVASLIGNARGEALILLHPQRVLLTIDDGATWSPIATPGIGARGLLRDGNGDLWLEGTLNEQMAKLAGSPLRLEVATSFTELHKPKDGVAAKKSKRPPQNAMVGTRIIEITDEMDPATKRKKIEVTVSPMGGNPTTPYVLAPSASPFTRVRSAGYENNVVVGVYDPEVEPRAVKLFRTLDDGKSWEPVGAIEGSEGPAFKLLAGPGWIGVGEMCGIAPPCTPPRMKVGTKDWQPIGLPTGVRATSVEYDAPRDRLFLLANEAGQTTFYTGKKEGPFTKVPVASPQAPLSATVDSNGTLRLAYSYPARIVKIDPSGKDPAIYLPFQSDGISLAGDRGYAWVHDQAWETADGGEHWTKVAAGAPGPATCSTAGCTKGDAIRIGWELPDTQKPLLASTATPPGDAPPIKVTAQSPLTISCKPTGPFKSYKGSISPDSRHALGGDVRFLAPIPDAGGYRAIVVARGADAPKTINLLPPAPKGKADSDNRSWFASNSAGFVTTRYTFSTNVKTDGEGVKKYNPVDVEIGWYVAATGKNFKSSIPGVKPFRVGRTGPSAMTSIVEGGLLFLPNRGEAPLYFLAEDGKTEVIPRPGGVDEFGFTDAVKKGTTIILSQSRGDDLALVASLDGGKTWTTKMWTVGDFAPLEMIDGKPGVLLLPGMGPGMAPGMGENESGGILSFQTVTPDPPLAVRPARRATVIDGKGVTACTTMTGARFHVSAEGDRLARVTISTETTPIEVYTSKGWMRLSGDGSACTDLLYGSIGGDESERFVAIAPADPAHGWLLQTKGWTPTFEARPIACTIGP